MSFWFDTTVNSQQILFYIYDICDFNLKHLNYCLVLGVIDVYFFTNTIIGFLTSLVQTKQRLPLNIPRILFSVGCINLRSPSSYNGEVPTQNLDIAIYILDQKCGMMYKVKYMRQRTLNNLKHVQNCVFSRKVRTDTNVNPPLTMTQEP